MKYRKKVSVYIQICGICGILWETAHRKYYRNRPDYVGFRGEHFKGLGMQHICPGCEKIEKEHSVLFEQIISAKQNILRLLRRARRRPHV